MSIRIHDLLEIDAERFIANQTSVPEWIEASLRESPFLVARRGLATGQKIPVGVRGNERNQRWAAFCDTQLIKSVSTPPKLLGQPLLMRRADVTPALQALQLLKERWTILDRWWGPAGSVGFELATGKPTVKPESDLDVVIYAEDPMTVIEAKSLWSYVVDLPATVDIRVETPVCGFSLIEFANESPGQCLLRTATGLRFGTDPWRPLN